MAPRTFAYIDGFNLYYGAVRGTPHKWLDLLALCRRIAPRNEVVRVKYFTAKVHPVPHDPDIVARQAAFLRALETFPEIEIIYGTFLRSSLKAPLANSSGQIVEILRTEEKGSDVNLAVHLLNDAWLEAFEAAIVVSNDSDLAEAIRLVVQQRKKPVGVVNPQIRANRRMAVYLSRVASFHLRIAPSDLKACQLPDPIPGTRIRRPRAWDLPRGR